MGGNVDRHKEELESWSRMLARSMDQALDLASGLEEVHSQLGQIGQRLPALRARIAPLQSRSEQAHRADRHIDAAVEAARVALERLERLRLLERVIEGGDPAEDIAGYLSAVAELEGAAQLGNAGDGGEERLLEIAATKLEGEFQRLVRESSGVCDSSSEGFGKRRRNSRKKKHSQQALVVVAMEDRVVEKLHMILARMVAVVSGGVERCLRVYQRERIDKLRRGSLLVDVILESYSRSKQDQQSENSILEWNGHLEAINAVLAAELELCSKVFGGVVEPWQVNECLARIAGPTGMHALLEFGESFVRLDRQQHQTHRPEKIFTLLNMYETLQQVGASISQELFAGKGECSTHIRVRTRELHKMVVDAAAKLFYGFKTHLRSNDVDLGAPRDAGVDKLSSYVVNYVKAVTSDAYAGSMEQVLRIEQSWKNPTPSPKPAHLEQLLLEQAIVDMIASLEEALLAKSKHWYKDPVHQRIFLMNNAYYVFNRIKSLKIQQRSGSNGDTIRQLVIRDPWLKERRARVQEHALGYQKEGWGKVLGQLSRQGLFLVSGAEAARQLVKQRLESFTAALQETCLKHECVGIPDQELRDATKAAVLHNIVPAYRSYLQSYGPLVDPACVRFSAAEVEATLTQLFDSMVSMA